MKKFKILYNLDMTAIPLTVTPMKPDYNSSVNREHVLQMVRDAKDTAVDAFFCCPMLLRLPIWRSKEEPCWEPENIYYSNRPQCDHTTSENTYCLMRDYILSGHDPVDEVYSEVKKCGMDFFFSYRMNDWHYLEEPDKSRLPSVDSFYKKHPEYMIGSPNLENPVGWCIKNPLQQNYLIPEVRRHYLNLLGELVDRWDIDGLELDLMRSPNYFPLEKLDEGTRVMTGFVHSVREMLDKAGRERGKFIPLCVRVPHRYSYCARIGFDLPEWVSKGYIQMVNVSPSYFHTEALEIEEFRKALPDALIYGEEEMVLNNRINRFGWPSERRNTPEILETTANSFLNRGADGVSIFNYQFTREILQPCHDPDSVYTEPPKEPLIHMADREYLETCPKHYVFYGYNDLTFDGSLPSREGAVTSIRIWDNTADYSSARLRLVCRNDVAETRKAVTFNGHKLNLSAENGELFPEKVREGQFLPSQTANFDVPIELVTTVNTVEISLSDPDAEIFGVELALYR